MSVCVFVSSCVPVSGLVSVQCVSSLPETVHCGQSDEALCVKAEGP